MTEGENVQRIPFYLRMWVILLLFFTAFGTIPAIVLFIVRLKKYPAGRKRALLGMGIAVAVLVLSFVAAAYISTADQRTIDNYIKNGNFSAALDYVDRTYDASTYLYHSKKAEIYAAENNYDEAANCILTYLGQQTDFTSVPADVRQQLKNYKHRVSESMRAEIERISVEIDYAIAEKAALKAAADKEAKDAKAVADWIAAHIDKDMDEKDAASARERFARETFDKVWRAEVKTLLSDIQAADPESSAFKTGTEELRQYCALYQTVWTESSSLRPFFDAVEKLAEVKAEAAEKSARIRKLASEGGIPADRPVLVGSFYIRQRLQTSDHNLVGAILREMESYDTTGGSEWLAYDTSNSPNLWSVKNEDTYILRADSYSPFSGAGEQTLYYYETSETKTLIDDSGFNFDAPVLKIVENYEEALERKNEIAILTVDLQVDIERQKQLANQAAEAFGEEEAASELSNHADDAASDNRSSEEPAPDNPAPENTVPETPTPETPAPENSVSENSVPENPTPGNSGPASSSVEIPPENVSYSPCNIREMLKTLRSDVSNARELYDGQYILVEGILEEIGPGGEYCILSGKRNDTSGGVVYCSVQNNAVRDFLTERSPGDTVDISGKVIGVLENYGYTITAYKASQNIIPMDAFDHKLPYEMAGFYSGTGEEASALYASIEDEFYGGYHVSLYRTDFIEVRSYTSMKENLLFSEDMEKNGLVCMEMDGFYRFIIHIIDQDTFVLDDMMDGYYSGLYTRETYG